MKISSRQISVGFFVGLAIIVLAILFTHPAQSRNSIADGRAVVPDHQTPASKSHLAADIAPFIVSDTDDDSSGTNLDTRLVTFSAEIGGTPVPALQWKVDKGGGFTDIPGATNATYRVRNAQVEYNGFYALFATNSAGSIHTTPQRLFVEEGED